MRHEIFFGHALRRERIERASYTGWRRPVDSLRLAACLSSIPLLSLFPCLACARVGVGVGVGVDVCVCGRVWICFTRSLPLVASLLRCLVAFKHHPSEL